VGVKPRKTVFKQMESNAINVFLQVVENQCKEAMFTLLGSVPNGAFIKF